MERPEVCIGNLGPFRRRIRPFVVVPCERTARTASPLAPRPRPQCPFCPRPSHRCGAVGDAEWEPKGVPPCQSGPRWPVRRAPAAVVSPRVDRSLWGSAVGMAPVSLRLPGRRGCLGPFRVPRCCRCTPFPLTSPHPFSLTEHLRALRPLSPLRHLPCTPDRTAAPIAYRPLSIAYVPSRITRMFTSVLPRRPLAPRPFPTSSEQWDKRSTVTRKIAATSDPDALSRRSGVLPVVLYIRRGDEGEESSWHIQTRPDTNALAKVG